MAGRAPHERYAEPRRCVATAGPDDRPEKPGAMGNDWHRWQESNLQASVLETEPRPRAHRYMSIASS